MRKLLRHAVKSPRVMISSTALRERRWNYELSYGASDRTIAGKVASANEAKERIMKRFTSPRQVQTFLSIHVSSRQFLSLSLSQTFGPQL